MSHFDEPTYVYDFRNTLNCVTTEAAEPGQEIPVLVREASNTEGPAIRATGIRSAGGKELHITVTTEAGQQKFTWNWQTLLDAIRAHKGTPR